MSSYLSIRFDPRSDEKDTEGLKAWYKGISDYADGVGVWKDDILSDPFHPPTTSNIVTLAHNSQLFVHVYTFRSDIKFLHVAYGGNPTEEYMLFFRLGIDGVCLFFSLFIFFNLYILLFTVFKAFSDFASHAVHARDVCLHFSSIPSALLILSG